MWKMIAVLVSLMLTSTATAQSHDRTDRIDALIDQALPASGAPGLAYAIVDANGSTVGAHGVTRLGGDIAITPDTPFPLGSISKSLTALAVIQLVEAGHLDLDDRISAHLEVFQDQPGGAITIRQLLSHTSGYSTFQGNRAHTGNEHDLVGQLARTRPALPSGQHWQYSNANYAILGRLIETLSGLEFPVYIQNEVLAPAGMSQSFIIAGEDARDVAIGHTPWFTGKRAVPEGGLSDGMAAAGGVMASASDVARYLEIMLNGEDDLIRADNKVLMLQPASDASPFYGLGWFIDPATERAYHTGLVPGSEAVAILSPSDQRGAVVLVNTNSGMGYGLTADLLWGISTLGLGEAYQPIQTQLATQLFFLMLMALPLFFLAAIAGAWFLRKGLRAKSGFSGLFSLWFPLLATTAMSWVFLVLLPQLFGTPLGTLGLYQPDMVILLIAGSVSGFALAVIRLGLYYVFPRV